jgi:phage terminase large subunit-like protein
MTSSLLEAALAAVGPEKLQAELEEKFGKRKAADLLRLGWRSLRRPAQTPPQGDWFWWLILAGRGFGKTRCGSEEVHEWAQQKGCRTALVGRTDRDVRRILIEGEGGILETQKPWNRCEYQPGLGRIVWPKTGAQAFVYTADRPDNLRGPQHHRALMDEFCAFQYPEEVVQNLTMGLRLGRAPRALVTTTPRPIKALRDLMSRKSIVVTGGSTYENAANLPERYLAELLDIYEGTTIGRQELHAMILEEVEGALWTQKKIDELRFGRTPGDDRTFAEILFELVASLTHIVVGIDVAVSSTGAETGIVVVGVDRDDHLWTLDDVSVQGKPETWGQAALDVAEEWQADGFIVEMNQGGDLIAANLRACAGEKADDLVIHEVHASRGKRTRAEPISTRTEKGKVHHVGHFAELEKQLTTWVPGKKSPDRLDAFVWAAIGALQLARSVIAPARPSKARTRSKWRGV